MVCIAPFKTWCERRKRARDAARRLVPLQEEAVAEYSGATASRSQASATAAAPATRTASGGSDELIDDELLSRLRLLLHPEEAMSIPECVRKLNSVSIEDQTTALCGLWSRTCKEDGSAAREATAICDADAIPRLVVLLSSTDHKVQSIAAAVLGNLMVEDKQCIMEAAAVGAVAPLVALLSTSGDEFMKRCAAGALESLADHVESCTLNIHAGGAVRPLVDMLDQSHDRISKVRAAGLLWTLTNLESARSAMLVSGAIPRLVGMLRAAAEDEDLIAKQRAIGVLAKLTNRNTAASREFHEAQGIKTLVQVMISTPQLSTLLVAMLGNVLQMDDNTGTFCKEAIAAGAVPALVDLLRDGTPEQQCCAAGAVASLVQHVESSRVQVRDAGAVPLLERLEDSRDPTTKVRAALALGYLNGAGGGGLKSRHQSSPGGRGLVCVDSFGSLSGSTDSGSTGSESPQATAPSQESVSDWLEQLSSSSTKTQEKALLYLGLATSADTVSSVQIREMGHIPRIVQLLGGDTACVRTLAAALLGNILVDDGESSGSIVLAAGAVQPLVTMLSSSEDNTLNRCAPVFTLGLLAQAESSSKGEIIAAGAVGPLVRLLEEGSSEEAARLACSALLTLTIGTDETCFNIRTSGGVPRLVELLSPAHEGSELQRTACATLGNVVYHDPASCTAAFEAGCTSHLVRLLSSSDEDLQCYAAGALACITRRVGEAGAAVREHGGLLLLRHLVMEGEGETQRRAATALYNIL